MIVQRNVTDTAEGIKEDFESWHNFFIWLKERGLTGVRLIVGCKCLAMLESIAEVFLGAKYQRCVVHFYRNVFSVVSPRQDAGSILNAESHPLAGEQRGVCRLTARNLMAEIEFAKKLDTIDGAPVIGKTSDIEKLFGDYRKLLVTIGNNALRGKLYKRAEKCGYTFPNIIVSSAYISPHAKLGSGIVILNIAVVQNNAKIGDGTILNPDVEAHHDSTIGKYCIVYTNSVVRSLTHVGDRAWIGSTVTVSTGVEVEADAVIEDGQWSRRCSNY